MTTEELSERLTRMETTLERLDKELLGNGQPGRVAKIEARLVPLEATEAKARGAFWMLSGIVSFIFGGGLIHIFSKR